MGLSASASSARRERRNIPRPTGPEDDDEDLDDLGELHGHRAPLAQEVIHRQVDDDR